MTCAYLIYTTGGCFAIINCRAWIFRTFIIGFIATSWRHQSYYWSKSQYNEAQFTHAWFRRLPVTNLYFLILRIVHNLWTTNDLLANKLFDWVVVTIATTLECLFYSNVLLSTSLFIANLFHFEICILLVYFSFNQWFEPRRDNFIKERC